jgi:uncharacterized membrane protein
MKKEKIIQELTLVLIALLPVLYLFMNWNLLPESIPVHFDLKGNPNGYGSRWVYVIMPVGLYLLMLALPKIDPRKANYDVFEGSYYKLRLILGIFFGMITVSVVWGIVNHSNATQKFMPLSLFFLFMLIGNYLGNIRPNYFVGIKVPWTLNNDEVWTRTHKMAGKLWFWGSLVGMALYFVVEKMEYVFIPLLVILVVVPIVYSYVIYKKLG